MWRLDHKENWALKNWCFELLCWRRLKSPSGRKEIQSVQRSIVTLSPLLYVGHLQEFILWGCLWELESSPEMTWYGDGMMLGLRRLWQHQVHSEASSHGCRKYGSLGLSFSLWQLVLYWFAQLVLFYWLHKGQPWLRSFSVAQHSKCSNVTLTGVLYCTAACASMWGESI